MNVTATAAADTSFVVLQVGSRRFALPADNVVELAPPVRLHKFPHQTALIVGVIVRRGRIVPVYDAGSLLGGRSSSAQRFYLIAKRRVGKAVEFAAVPVNGECELATGEVAAPPPDGPSWLTGAISFKGEAADVLDLDALVTRKLAADQSNSGEPAS